jgi:uncharacterized membrane protein YedE/YeeE
MNAFASILCIVGVILWATPVWLALIMEILFRYGMGRRRSGVLRRISMIEWLNVTGGCILLGSILFGLGNSLRRTYAEH